MATIVKTFPLNFMEELFANEPSPIITIELSNGKALELDNARFVTMKISKHKNTLTLKQFLKLQRKFMSCGISDKKFKEGKRCANWSGLLPCKRCKRASEEVSKNSKGKS